MNLRRWIVGVVLLWVVVISAGGILLANAVMLATQAVTLAGDLTEQQELQRLAIKRNAAQLKQLETRRSDLRDGAYEVTAYTCQKAETGKSPGDPGYCVTANGTRLTPAHEKKVVAADPKVFGFGTRLWVQGVGEVTVVDTGGAIKGKALDLFMGEKKVKEAWEFGRRGLEVRVLP